MSRCAGLPSKESIFVAEVLAAVRLPETHNRRRVEGASLRGRAACNSKTKRDVVHVEDHDALVLGALLRPPANMRLAYVSTVEERHLTVAPDPYLVSCVGGEQRQARDVLESLISISCGMEWILFWGVGVPIGIYQTW